MKTWHLVSTLVVASLVFFSGAAFAEGFWTSFLQDVHVSFESRRWFDNHNDANGTTIRFDTCRDVIPENDPNDRADVGLYRDIDFFPDEERGILTLFCYSSDTRNWGEQPTPGNYHFTIKAITGLVESWQDLDASYVETNY